MELIACNNPQKDSISTFDTFCTHPHIQQLKILIPFVAPSLQGMLAFYIKLMELQYTIQLFKSYKGICFSKQTMDFNRIYDELDPYLSLSERSHLKSMKDMFQSFTEMKDMMDMVNSMKDMFPNGFDMNDLGGMDNIFEAMNQFGGMNGTDT